MDWRKLPPETLESHYNPRLAVPDHPQWFADYAAWSAAALARMPGTQDLRYGPGPLQTLDVHPGAGPDAPILVFIHGGYWRALDKRDHVFPLEAHVAAGATVVNLNYDLCPAITLVEMIGQVRAAIDWIVAATSEIPGDRNRIHLAGHSAGAHLAAMILHYPTPVPIRSAALLSGVYDTETVLHIPVNEAVRLDAEMARATSALLHGPTQKANLLVVVGDAEPEGWIGHSAAYHEVCRKAGLASDFWRLAGEHHFSILKAMGEPDHPMFAWIRRQLAQR